MVIAENRRIGRKIQSVSEYAASNRLGSLHKLQLQYKAAHPRLGFACRLSDLRVLDTEKTSPSFFYDGGWVDGYRFTLSGCEGSKPNNRYAFVAVPVDDYLGTKSFCVDEIGVVFSDKDASGLHCLSSRRPLH
jgi:hypothetical protein